MDEGKGCSMDGCGTRHQVNMRADPAVRQTMTNSTHLTTFWLTVSANLTLKMAPTVMPAAIRMAGTQSTWPEGINTANAAMLKKPVHTTFKALVRVRS